MIIRIPYRPRGHDFIDPQDFPSYASTSKKRTVVKDSLFSPACQSEKAIMIFPLISAHFFCIIFHTNKLEIFSVYPLFLYSYGYGAINLITQTGGEYGRERIKHEGSGEYGATKWTKNLPIIFKGGTIMSMTKIDIIDSIYERFGIPKKDCVSMVESVFDIIKDDLDKGNAVMISGFGKWTVKAKKERKGRNPQTGEALMIDARKVVTFKPSTVLRDAVNSGEGRNLNR